MQRHYRADAKKLEPTNTKTHPRTEDAKKQQQKTIVVPSDSQDENAMVMESSVRKLDFLKPEKSEYTRLCRAFVSPESQTNDDKVRLNLTFPGVRIFDKKDSELPGVYSVSLSASEHQLDQISELDDAMLDHSDEIVARYFPKMNHEYLEEYYRYSLDGKNISFVISNMVGTQNKSSADLIDELLSSPRKDKKYDITFRFLGMLFERKLMYPLWSIATIKPTVPSTNLKSRACPEAEEKQQQSRVSEKDPRKQFSFLSDDESGDEDEEDDEDEEKYDEDEEEDDEDDEDDDEDEEDEDDEEKEKEMSRGGRADGNPAHLLFDDPEIERNSGPDVEDPAVPSWEDYEDIRSKTMERIENKMKKHQRILDELLSAHADLRKSNRSFQLPALDRAADIISDSEQ